MSNLKELNVKIASLKNTQKMTKTMKLVSASKLRRAQQAQAGARHYANSLRQVLSNVAAGDIADHPLVTPRNPPRRALVLLVTSDRGLCSGFNNTLCRYLSRWLDIAKADFEHLDMSFCGRRGHAFFRNRVTVKRVYEGVTDRPRHQDSEAIADDLMELFRRGAYDQVLVAYNLYHSPLLQIPTLEPLLPIPRPAVNELAPSGPYLVEPDPSGLLDRFLPRAVRFEVHQVLLENAVGEHAARMTAMDSATRNAKDLIEFYTLKRNRERQAAITTELTEIVTGAEAL